MSAKATRKHAAWRTRLRAAATASSSPSSPRARAMWRQAEDALAEAFAAALARLAAEGLPVQSRSLADDGCAPEADRWRAAPSHRRSRDRRICRCSPKVSRRPKSIGEIPDQRLALMFACAHPAIEIGIRAPLILADRAGARCEDDRVRVPRLAHHDGQAPRARQGQDPASRHPVRRPAARASLAARLQAVLDAIYAAFAEGWSDPVGTDIARRDLTEEALFLARLVTELLPAEAGGAGSRSR